MKHFDVNHTPFTRSDPRWEATASKASGTVNSVSQVQTQTQVSHPAQPVPKVVPPVDTRNACLARGIWGNVVKDYSLSREPELQTQTYDDTFEPAVTQTEPGNSTIDTMV